MNKQNIKFTVIIPTRERSDTLQWSLKTCVTQDYDNLEIIVSDNFSQDNTREIVESYQDQRIRYINTGKRVSMSSNWEFALSHVEIDQQRYVTFVGDDDGLMPNALQDLNELIKTIGDVDAITWAKAQYSWKNCIANRNILSIPLKKKLARLDTKSILEKILTFDVPSKGLPYEKLPCLYNSFVRTTNIQAVKSKSARFFNSMIPDVYSAMALSSVIDYHYWSDRPYSVNGASKHSNGTSNSAGNSLEEKQAALKFISEIDIPFHPNLLYGSAIPILIAESALQVKDHLGFDVRIDIDKMLQRSFEQAKYSGASNRMEVLHDISVIATNYGIDNAKYADEVNLKGLNKSKTLLFRWLKNALVGNYAFMALFALLRVNTLRINGDIAKLGNIYDATILTSQVLRLFDGISYTSVARRVSASENVLQHTAKEAK
jgi:glycosyltransferase involved in cell wall biosynthesis